MKLPILLTAFAIALTLASCATPPPLPPPRNPLQSIEHERPPANAAHRDITEAEKQAVIKALRNRLKDPESARFEWPQVVLNPNTLGDGYCGFVNAKNSMGGYTGFTLYYAIIFKHDKTGEPISAIIDIGGASVAQLCSFYGYLPWR